jgi:hypothetical protein
MTVLVPLAPLITLTALWARSPEHHDKLPQTMAVLIGSTPDGR